MKVSFIVAIYRVEQWLKKCIDSIRIQSGSDFEIILVDDGSPDNCPRICDEYAELDNRIKVIHKPNGGLTSAKNAGIKVATGDYICYVDGDDWIDETLLKTVTSSVLTGHEPDIIVFVMRKVYENSFKDYPCNLKEGYYDKQRLEKEVIPYMMWDSRKDFYQGVVFPSAGGKMIRKVLLDKYYCKDERISLGEDNSYVFPCIYNADSMYVLKKILYYYRKNENSIVHKYNSKRFENTKILFEYMENSLDLSNESVKRQFNAFKAYWLYIAIQHEMSSEKKLWPKIRFIRANLKRYMLLGEVRFFDDKQLLFGILKFLRTNIRGGKYKEL